MQQQTSGTWSIGPDTFRPSARETSQSPDVCDNGRYGVTPRGADAFSVAPRPHQYKRMAESMTHDRRISMTSYSRASPGENAG